VHSALRAELGLEPSSGSRWRALFEALRRSERGQAMAEFAILIFPLALIMFGILDFGRALDYYNSVTQLAGQGARAAAVQENPNGGAADGTFQSQLKSLSTIAEAPARVTVCVSGTHNTAGATWVAGAPWQSGQNLSVGDTVTVTVKYAFHFIPLVHGANITLTAKQSERLEATSTNASFQPGSGGTGTCP
jgi:Flp pilus assembly protein TadG